MTIDRNGETDPRYQVDSPKDTQLCQCCEEEEAKDYWETVQGRKYICAGCLYFHFNEDTNYLIQQIK